MTIYCLHLRVGERAHQRLNGGSGPHPKEAMCHIPASPQRAHWQICTVCGVRHLQSRLRLGQAQAGDAVVMALRRVFDWSCANTAVGRHLITGIGRDGKDSNIIVVGFRIYTASSSSLSRHYLHASGQLASQLDWREPIGLQERLEGRSSHNGEFLGDVS